MAAIPGLEVNLKISVARQGDDEWYASSVQDFGEDWLDIAVPYYQEVPLVLRVGELVSVKFFHRDGVFLFTTRVIDRRSDNIRLYRLAMPAEVRRIQQRRYVRLPVMIEAEYAEQPQQEGEKPRYYKTTILDISAGGVKLALERQYEKGTVLLLRFSISIKDKVHEFELKARVVRNEPVEASGRALYHTGVQFLDINRNQEDIIVRFIFQKMSEQRWMR